MQDNPGNQAGRPHTIPSRIVLGGEPIHPMLIHFPMALLIGALPADLAFLYTQDPFWARASLWLVGAGTLGGWGAGLVGFIDITLVPGIRRLITGWCHGIVAVMMLSLASFNWLLRVGDYTNIYPWALMLSGITVLLVVVAGILGGRLVYEHGVGVELED